MFVSVSSLFFSFSSFHTFSVCDFSFVFSNMLPLFLLLSINNYFVFSSLPFSVIFCGISRFSSLAFPAFLQSFSVFFGFSRFSSQAFPIFFSGISRFFWHFPFSSLTLPVFLRCHFPFLLWDFSLSSLAFPARLLFRLFSCFFFPSFLLLHLSHFSSLPSLGRLTTLGKQRAREIR